MAININAKTTGVGGLETSADNSGNINIQSGGTTVMSVTSSGVAVTGSFSQNGAVYSTQPSFRNLIINGDMRIDQRYAGGAISAATLGGYGYMVDRWWFYGSQSSKFNAQQNQGSVTPPDDFKHYLGMTVDSAYSIGASDQFIVATRLEGLNTAHLKWGTANAKTITISYYVRSSLTGTFNGYIRNSAANRSYPFTYTISSANTWEKKTVTIAGDTTGTWLETNGTGIELGFNLGSGASVSGTANTWAAANYTGATGATSVVGTSGATFYITGVQLEVGSTATDFENLPYDVQLARCQRYFEKSYDIGVTAGTASQNGNLTTTSSSNTTAQMAGAYFKVRKRAVPTCTAYNSISGASGGCYRYNDGANIGLTFNGVGEYGIGRATLASGSANTYLWHFVAAAEL
jgi:hypothetical protein